MNIVAKAAIGLLVLSVVFMIAYAVSGEIVSSLITGTSTGDTLINNLWLLVLAGVGLVMLVRQGFAD